LDPPPNDEVQTTGFDEFEADFRDEVDDEADEEGKSAKKVIKKYPSINCHGCAFCWIMEEFIFNFIRNFLKK
jgi:hypothetical protein